MAADENVHVKHAVPPLFFLFYIWSHKGADCTGWSILLQSGRHTTIVRSGLSLQSRHNERGGDSNHHLLD